MLAGRLDSSYLHHQLSHHPVQQVSQQTEGVEGGMRLGRGQDLAGMRHGSLQEGAGLLMMAHTGSYPPFSRLPCPLSLFELALAKSLVKILPSLSFDLERLTVANFVTLCTMVL